MVATPNEGGYIVGALGSSDCERHAAARLEVIIVDVMSEGSTRSLVKSAQSRSSVPVRLKGDSM